MTFSRHIEKILWHPLVGYLIHNKNNNNNVPNSIKSHSKLERECQSLQNCCENCITVAANYTLIAKCILAVRLQRRTQVARNTQQCAMCCAVASNTPLAGNNHRECTREHLSPRRLTTIPKHTQLILLPNFC